MLYQIFSVAIKIRQPCLLNNHTQCVHYFDNILLFLYGILLMYSDIKLWHTICHYYEQDYVCRFIYQDLNK